MQNDQIITNGMKKIYSTVMMLAMMVAALSFTACGGDDDEVDNGGGSNTALTITVDGQEHNYSSGYLEYMDLLGTWETSSVGNFLSIGVPSLVSEFRIYYPKDTNPSSYFKVGYDTFEDDATEICLSGGSRHNCSYVKGSAKVTKNDGKNLTVKFSKYTFTWNSGGREIIFDGTLNFVLYY